MPNLPEGVTMTVHQCPKCELRFGLKTELDDHCWHDHPEFRHEYPAARPAPQPAEGGDTERTESVVALLREPGEWTEGHLVVRGSSLTFIPLHRPTGEGSISATVASHTVTQETHIRLFTEYGMSLARTWQLTVEDLDGKRLLFAVRRQDCSVISAALGDAPGPRSREESAR
jgi:hypothetical protein